MAVEYKMKVGCVCVCVKEKNRDDETCGFYIKADNRVHFPDVEYCNDGTTTFSMSDYHIRHVTDNH